MPSSYSLSPIEELQIEALVKAGYYTSKSAVVRDAIRYLLEKDSSKRIVAAVQLYIDKKVSLSEAAELARMTTLEFETILAERGFTDSLSKEKIKTWIDKEAGTGEYSIEKLKKQLDKERENWV